MTAARIATGRRRWGRRLLLELRRRLLVIAAARWPRVATSRLVRWLLLGLGLRLTCFGLIRPRHHRSRSRRPASSRCRRIRRPTVPNSGSRPQPSPAPRRPPRELLSPWRPWIPRLAPLRVSRRRPKCRTRRRQPCESLSTAELLCLGAAGLALDRNSRAGDGRADHDDRQRLEPEARAAGVVRQPCRRGTAPPAPPASASARTRGNERLRRPPHAG